MRHVILLSLAVFALTVSYWLISVLVELTGGARGLVRVKLLTGAWLLGLMALATGGRCSDGDSGDRGPTCYDTAWYGPDTDDTRDSGDSASDSGSKGDSGDSAYPTCYDTGNW